ncbi:MAG: hypothetical protein ACREI9_00370 [Nitrospiraceae bacterium]
MKTVSDTFSFQLSKAAFLLVILLAFTACSPDTKITLECTSPDGQILASFYIYSGGGAAGYQLERVNIRESGNPFEPQSYVLELKDGYDIHLFWQAPLRLLVEYPSDARLDQAIPQYLVGGKAIEIHYRALPSKNGLFLDGKTECMNT